MLLRSGRIAPGLKGRIFSGIGRVPTQEAPAKKRKDNEGAVDSARAEFMKQLPPEIRKEIEMGVPDTLVGRSAFAFKKLVRYIARHRLGSVELNIKNLFFQLFSCRPSWRSIWTTVRRSLRRSPAFHKLPDIPLASDEGERGELALRLRDGGAPLPRGRF